jgi:hypothetical protein
MSTHTLLTRLLPVFLFVVAWFAVPAPAWACSCIMPEPPPNSYAQANAVFAGTVSGISDFQQLPGFGLLVQVWPDAATRFYERRVAFSVSDSWKGVSTTRVTLRTGHGDADCGYPFAVGASYVVYAYESEGALGTNICTRTADASAAVDDWNYLNTLPRLPLSPAPSPALVGAGLAALAGLAVAVAVWRGRRPPRQD